MDERRLRVLLVDDVVDLRVLLRVALESDGRFAVVAEAGNGRDAIVCAQECHPDVIVLDHAMPIMTGLEALPALRAAVPDARIVLFSAVADRFEGRCPDGLDGIVAKGDDLKAVLAVITGDAQGLIDTVRNGRDEFA